MITIEEASRELVRDLLGPANDREAERAFEVLRDRLVSNVAKIAGGASALVTKLRIAVAIESVRSGGVRRMALRVNFAWHREPGGSPRYLAIAPMFRDRADPLAELPGTPAYAIRVGRKRQRAAVDLLLRMMLGIAIAHARARAGAELLLVVLRVALRAWSSSPGLLELDIERAPFGVDLEEARVDAALAARVALLELD